MLLQVRKKPPPITAELRAMLDGVAEPAILLAIDHQILAANTAYRAKYGEVGTSCYTASHDFDTPCDENGEVCGMTANSFVTVSLSPPTVLVSVMPGRMHRAISASGRYCVNVLPEQGRELSRHFASRPGATAVPEYEIVDGLPRLSGCMAYFACEVVRLVDPDRPLPGVL